jgi:DNA-binding Lrp family transcriptional regulator
MAKKARKGLSDKHKKILEILIDYQAREGFPPSIREICAEANISSTSVANYYLDRLEKLGYIERDRSVSRGIRIVKKAQYEISPQIPQVIELEISPKVFISYAREDKDEVCNLYEFLKQNGLSPWFDDYNLLPGEDWNFKIERAIEKSDFVIICLSQNSVTKRGYIQKEMRKAQSVLEEIPEGDIFIIPIRLEECEVPSSLLSKHWLDWYSKDAKEKLLRVFDYPNISERFKKKIKISHHNDPNKYVFDALSRDKPIDEIISNLIFGFDLKPTRAEEIFNSCYSKWINY